MKHGLVAAILCLAAAPLSAQQSEWEYTATLSGWLSGLGSSVETRFGTVETELDFADVLEKLDFAVFGSFEARNGRWALVTDLVHSDLGSEVASPFGVAFRRAEIDARLTLFSAYAAYAMIDEPDFRFEIGPGFRYNDTSIDLRFVGNAVATRRLEVSNSWVDALIGARMRFNFSEDWFGTAFVDVGGFGLEDASDTTWQAYLGLGYRFNETWAVQAGYRTLSIEREFNGRDITLDLNGPMVGVQVSF